jgi:hypothetical protein
MDYQSLDEMARKILIATIYSIIAFCVISYISVMISLLSSVGNLSRKPVANLGFPFKYYYQFWLRGSDSPNCGWKFDNFALDCFIIWILTAAIYLMAKRKK